MRELRGRILVLVTSIGLLLALSETAEARRLPPRGGGVPQEVAELRREVAELRAAMALLESRLNFELRQDPRENAPSMAFCGDPCVEDADGDGIGDCEDLCPCDATNADGDLDGALDCLDPCPDDATNACIDPCTWDSDGDGTRDCEDACPYDPTTAVDTDGDGVPDCADPCTNDPSNTCGGMCPTGLDQDGDGLDDCSDPCPYGQRDGQCLDPATGLGTNASNP